MRKSSGLLIALATMAAGLVSGCATFDMSSVVPGTSVAQVEAAVGQPTDKFTAPGGDSVWFYSRLPYGRVAYAVRIGADGKVLNVEQRLTEENTKKIVAGKMTREDVRMLLGSPNYITNYPRLNVETWEYPMVPGSMSLWMMLYVDFSSDGMVRDSWYTVDPVRNYLFVGGEKS